MLRLQLKKQERHFNQSLEWHRLTIFFGRCKPPLLYGIDGIPVQVCVKPPNNLHLSTLPFLLIATANTMVPCVPRRRA